MSMTNLGLSEIRPQQKISDEYLLDPNGKIVWNIVNDDVMGGVSRANFVHNERDKYWTFQGNISLANNGGFASIRIKPDHIDYSQFKGIELKVRGDGKTYGVSLNEDHYFTGFYYHHSFTTRREDWMIVRIDFDLFSPKYFGRPFDYQRKVDRTQIKEISLMISDKQEGEFHLEIAWIKLLPR